MTKHEKDIIVICHDVIKRMISRERRSWKKYPLQVTLSKLEKQLKEPVEEYENNGEFLKVDNPFTNV